MSAEKLDVLEERWERINLRVLQLQANTRADPQLAEFLDWDLARRRRDIQKRLSLITKEKRQRGYLLAFGSDRLASGSSHGVPSQEGKKRAFVSLAKAHQWEQRMVGKAVRARAGALPVVGRVGGGDGDDDRLAAGSRCTEQDSESDSECWGEWQPADASVKEKPKKDSASKTECPGDWKPTDASLKEKPKEGDDDCDHDWLAAGSQCTEANEEFVNTQRIKLLKVASEKNRADLLTKATKAETLLNLRASLGLLVASWPQAAAGTRWPAAVLEDDLVVNCYAEQNYTGLFLRPATRTLSPAVSSLHFMTTPLGEDGGRGRTSNSIGSE